VVVAKSNGGASGVKDLFFLFSSSGFRGNSAKHFDFSLEERSLRDGHRFSSHVPLDPTRRAERFDMLMKLKLVEALDLSPEQGDKFLPVFNQYRQRTQRLLRARGELIQDLTRHVRLKMGALEEGGEEGELTERELKERLAKLDELRRQQEANRDEFHERAGQVLSTEQLVRLIVFEERFAREIVRNLPNP